MLVDLCSLYSVSNLFYEIYYKIQILQKNVHIYVMRNNTADIVLPYCYSCVSLSDSN